MKKFIKALKYILNPISEKPEVLFDYYDEQKQEWILETKNKKDFDNYYKKLSLVRWLFWMLFGCYIGIVLENLS